jgi:hypothetical protein
MSSNNAGKELVWFVVIIVAIGVIWIATGGLKSLTKEDPYIKPAAPINTGQTYGKSNWLSFLFPFNVTPTGNTSSGSASKPVVSGAGVSVSPQASSVIKKTVSSSQKTYYGADTPPGPVVEVPDTVKIMSVSPSGDETSGTVKREYLTLTATETNKNKILLTGMLLKSRMTGKQADIRQGVTTYYANNVNREEPIFLKPGQTAYIISGRSPLGYSFMINKCIGYFSQKQDFIVSLSSNNCPKILDYPLPGRPNAFNDKCLDFLNTVPRCQSEIKYPADLQPECRTFVAERMGYSRCVADFGNDPNFLSGQWRVYLNRTESLWKTRREIIDLLDQNGNILSTYTY